MSGPMDGVRVLEDHDLYRLPISGEIPGEKVLVLPVGLAVDPFLLVVAHRGKRNSSRALSSTIWRTSSSGTSRNCSLATLRLFGQCESEWG